MSTRFLLVPVALLVLVLFPTGWATAFDVSAPVPISAVEEVRNLRNCGDLCNLDLPGIIQHYGYLVEHHPVTPADGKVTLNMYRIPCRRMEASCEQRPPVLLQHGLLDSGTTFVLNPIEQSLGFILADNGYDVWIGNNRGNAYSPCNNDECWKFSFDHMAQHDVPAHVEYVLNVTGQQKLAYVGHSQGTTQAFAAFSLREDIAERINLFIALAPAVYVNHQKSPLVTILADLNLVKLFQLFGVKSFLPPSFFLKAVAMLFCNGGWTTPLCEDVIFALCGTDPAKNHDFNQSRADVYLTHTPAGTSVQNMAHWSQAVKSSSFRMYDWGKKGNQQHYGQDFPPTYDISKVHVPTAIFAGGTDYLADPQDVQRLMSDLPSGTVIHYNFQPNYSHLDFVWGMDCKDLIYPDVLELLAKYARLPSN